MRTTLFRIAKNGSLVAIGLLIFGAMFGQVAGMWVSSQSAPRSGPILESEYVLPSEKKDGIADSLQWRMPLYMAGWGFALVAGFELLAGMWRQPVKPKTEVPLKADEAEQMVQAFLKDAEANATNLAQTPAPASLTKSPLAETVHANS